jgi:flagellar motility protein MotE (MotC chaperone)
MKKLLLPAALLLGAAVLFTVAFLGFAWMRADGPHELPLIGGLFPEPAPEVVDEAEPELAAAPEQAPPAARAGLGLLDVFRVDSGIDKAELSTLAATLKSRLAALEARQAELDGEEERLAERAELLDEQMNTIHALRTELERWQTELEQREAVLKRDEAVEGERDAASWAKLSKLFEKGDASSLAAKLASYSPEEAARVLVGLKPDRARELLEKLGGESWKDYWEAYRRALGSQGVE